MSIDSVLNRISEIEDRIDSIFPQPAPQAPTTPAVASATVDASAHALPNAAAPFSVALAQAAGQAEIRPLAVAGAAGTDGLINKYSSQHGLDPDVVRAVVKAESDGDAKCVSNKGAMGLMQLMPDEVRSYGITNPFDPAQNIDGGCRQLKEKLRLFNGDLRLALAAYNAGSGAVRKYGGVPPYPETRAYVNKILGMLGRK